VKKKVDRIACPWLIRKFVDSDAEFVFLPHDTNWSAITDGTVFDVPNAELGHHGEYCSFDAIIRPLRHQRCTAPRIGENRSRGGQSTKGLSARRDRFGRDCGRLHAHQLGRFPKHAPPVRGVRRAIRPRQGKARAQVIAARADQERLTWISRMNATVPARFNITRGVQTIGAAYGALSGLRSSGVASPRYISVMIRGLPST
jgi:ChrB, C-terminal domain